jgi:hypothetical protein
MKIENRIMKIYGMASPGFLIAYHMNPAQT